MAILLILITALIAWYPLRHSKLAGFTSVLVMLSLSFAGYMYWGTGIQWQQYYRQQAQQVEAQAIMAKMDTAQVIRQLRSKLKKSFQYAEGWYLLGKLYAGQDQWQDAHEALQVAYQLKPDDERIGIYYVFIIWNLNEQHYTPEAYGILNKILEKNQHYPDALAMLAMDAFIRHAYPEAINYWQTLLSVLPPDSPDAKAVRRAIAKAQENMVQEKKHA